MGGFLYVWFKFKMLQIVYSQMSSNSCQNFTCRNFKRGGVGTNVDLEGRGGLCVCRRHATVTCVFVGAQEGRAHLTLSFWNISNFIIWWGYLWHIVESISRTLINMITLVTLGTWDRFDAFSIFIQCRIGLRGFATMKILEFCPLVDPTKIWYSCMFFFLCLQSPYGLIGQHKKH